MNVTQEEFEKAGGDPSKIPRIAKQMSKIPGMIEAEEQEKFDDGQVLTDAQEMMPEGELLFPKVAGVQIIRDVTGGVFNILNKMNSPLITGEIDDDNEYLNAIGFLLFLMAYKDVGQIVTWFMEGKEELERQYLIWSFENININILMQEHEVLGKMMEELGETVEELPVQEGGGKSKKK
jgi:hypothetical protein